MIHSARPTVSPVANIVLLDFDGRTDGHMCKKNDPYRRDCGVAEWMNSTGTWPRLLNLAKFQVFNII